LTQVSTGSIIVEIAKDKFGMVQMILPIDKASTPNRVLVNVHIHTEILSGETARRKANSWLLMNAGNLLRADNPELLLSEKLVWRFDVLLTYPQQGIVGAVGRLHLDALTADILDPDSVVQQFVNHADALIIS
jgi:hypothetical protein